MFLESGRGPVPSAARQPPIPAGRGVVRDGCGVVNVGGMVKLSDAIRTLVRMEMAREGAPTSERLAGIATALDAADHPDRKAGDNEQLARVRAAVRVAARCQSLLQQLVALADASGAAERAYGTSLVTWLTSVENLTPREAAALVHGGKELLDLPVIAAAALAGSVLPQQARVMARAMDELPANLPPVTVQAAERQLAEWASSHNSAELARLSSHLLSLVAPEAADLSTAARLEQQHAAAKRDRHLSFSRDGQGRLLIRGSLPSADGEAFQRIVDSYAAQIKRGLEAADPRVAAMSPGQRRADGLMALIHQHQQNALAPSHGGDRPRVVVTVNYDALLAKCVEAELVGSGERLPANELRRLACDADVLPVVLGGASLPLDVGRAQRLVTGPIRAALEVRDGGCVFPGCDRPPQGCEAHHITPWWAGGATAIGILVLVCAHLHGYVVWRLEWGRGVLGY